MSKMARNKGKRGERMVIDWLQPIVDEVAKELGVESVILQRNTVQSDCGGSDIVGLDWLGAEVKNCEAQGPAALAGWWEQTVEQCVRFKRANGSKRTPILFYTRNRNPIRVRMMGWTGGHDCNAGLPALVDIGADSFEGYFRVRLREEFAKLVA